MTIPNDELLARYVKFSGHIRASDQTVKPDAFMPPKDLELSVTRHADLAEEELWERGTAVAAQSDRSLHGRADIETTEVRKSGLDAVEYPLDDNPEHAHIVGWPIASDKPAQKSLAQQLAAAAVFVKNPDS